MAVELADINAFDSMDILEFLDFEPVMRLSKDVRMAARNLRSREIRYLVDTYYQIQDYRCQLANQIRALKEAGEPTEVVEWLYQQQYGLEQRLKSILNEWTNHNIVASWAKSITGIGPIIAAGLCAHIDITKAPTVGHIWRFAGLDPTVEWLPGQKRPWNARLKTLCVHPNCRVTTKRGIIPISEVRVGDWVLTHKNRWRKVTEVYTNWHQGPLFGLIGANCGNQVAWLTGGHPVYAAPVETWQSGRTFKVKESTQKDYGWYAVEDIQPRWKLLRPVVEERTNEIPVYKLEGVLKEGRIAAEGRWEGISAPKAVTIPAQIRLTPNLMRLFGLYIGEGHRNKTTLYWSFNENEKDLINFVIKQIKELTQTEPFVSHIPQNHCVQIGIGCKPLADLFTELLGNNGDDMRFPMEWLSLPDDLLQALWEGIIEAEGDHIGKYVGKRISLANIQLAHQVVALGLHDDYVYLDEIEPNGACRIHINQRQDREPRARKTLIFPIYVGPVYNLEVEEDHSYVVEGYAVHNCWKIGESFVKVKNNPKDVYGKIYEARKAYENEKNERGDYSEQAKLILSKKKIGKDTIAYQYYSEGKLPPGHIHARAKRYAVKLFLSAFHEIAYFVHYGALPPKPYVIEHLGHVDYIAPPNTHLIPGYQEARGMNI